MIFIAFLGQFFLHLIFFWSWTWEDYSPFYVLVLEYFINVHWWVHVQMLLRFLGKLCVCYHFLWFSVKCSIGKLFTREIFKMRLKFTMIIMKRGRGRRWSTLDQPQIIFSSCLRSMFYTFPTYQMYTTGMLNNLNKDVVICHDI